MRCCLPLHHTCRTAVPAGTWTAVAALCLFLGTMGYLTTTAFHRYVVRYLPLFRRWILGATLPARPLLGITGLLGANPALYLCAGGARCHSAGIPLPHRKRFAVHTILLHAPFCLGTVTVVHRYLTILSAGYRFLHWNTVLFWVQYLPCSFHRWVSLSGAFLTGHACHYRFYIFLRSVSRDSAYLLCHLPAPFISTTTCLLPVCLGGVPATS